MNIELSVRHTNPTNHNIERTVMNSINSNSQNSDDLKTTCNRNNFLSTSISYKLYCTLICVLWLLMVMMMMVVVVVIFDGSFYSNCSSKSSKSTMLCYNRYRHVAYPLLHSFYIEYSLALGLPISNY